MTRRSALTTALIALPALALGSFMALGSGELLVGGGVAGLGVGALLGAAAVLFLRLRSSLGTLTGVLALCTVSAVALALLALALPACPGTTLPVRCPAHYVGNWAVIGALTPLMLALLLAPAYAVFKLIKLVFDVRAGRRSVDLSGPRRFAEGMGWRRPADEVPTPAAPAAARVVRKGPRPDRSGPKNAPTPRRPRRTRPSAPRTSSR